MRYHYTLTRMAKIKIGSTTKAGEDAENLDHGYCAGGYVQWFGHSAKLFGSLLQNEICIYPRDPAITLHGHLFQRNGNSW